MKSAGKARNNGLYRHIRTSKEIIRNLLNDYINFYKEATPNPHLHIHVRPRYKNAVVINDHAYIDTEFAHHYALKKESLLSDDDRQMLYALMKKNLVL